MVIFKRWNSIIGWTCFAIAALTYLLTMEPNESLWDCGEFIATAYKLEVGHPPGNPLFLLIARFFTMFAFGNASLVPIMVNAMSALCSAFTILFLFWTITHLARKLVFVADKGELTTGGTIALLGAGAIGALAYTFTDTFWFSAVEGEVYAMSSLCTAITFWVILKWEDRVGEPYANKWLILLAFVIGLALGVHLLNILAIPAVGMVYYYKMYTPTWRGGTVAFIASCLIVGVIMLLIPGIPTIASWFELLFVNGFGLPYNSGTAVGFLAIVGFLFWACFYSWKKRKVLLNTIALFVTVIVVGYSAYALNIIRSSANPPINEAAPDNVFSFISYLNRDQYGSAPLLKGHTYATDAVGFQQSWVYTKKDGKYEKIPTSSYKFDPDSQMLLPRMHSQSHINEYIAWAEIKSSIVTLSQAQQLYSQGGGTLKQLAPNEIAENRLQPGQPYFRYTPAPTMSENLRFLFGYQLNWMYWRYFFWNFAGRQNDVQGHGDPMYGNWISGLSAIDNNRVPGLDDQPDYLKNNKANNRYYFIPFLLGLIGLCYQLIKDKRQWLVVALLFFFTGIAIVLYLNQTPLQPRERDYAYAGSFYAYAIWIGLAVLAFYELFSKVVKNKPAIAASLAITLCLSAPIILVAQNWDDHDRSGRYMARDIAYNYLMSCDPNAILFTVGDNDTFPLWYLQEVEGVRTDVRVTNLSLLAADWYIDQMKYKVYQSNPLPISLPRSAYLGEENNRIEADDRVGKPADLKWVMNFIANPKNKAIIDNSKTPTSYIPAKSFTLPVNSNNIRNTNLVKGVNPELIQDTITFSLPSNAIIKPQLMMYDIIANNNWERPIHFTAVGGESDIGLRDYMQYNGFTYKLVPIKTPSSSYGAITGRVDVEWMFDYLMNTCRWGNMDNPNVYVDYFYITTLVRIINIRGMYVSLADELMAQGDIERAKLVLDKIMQIMPEKNFPYCMGYYTNDMSMTSIVDAYYKTGQKDKATALATKLSDELEKNLTYFYPIKKDMSLEAYSTLYAIHSLYLIARSHNNNDIMQRLERPLKTFGLI